LRGCGDGEHEDGARLSSAAQNPTVARAFGGTRFEMNETERVEDLRVRKAPLEMAADEFRRLGHPNERSGKWEKNQEKSW
jgi:hypothetical protein